MKDELRFSVSLKVTSYDCTKNKFLLIPYRYFTRTWPRFSVTLHSFLKFLENLFTESLSIIAYDSSARVLCNRLCNVILHARLTPKRPRELTHPTHLQNDIAPKEVYKGLQKSKVRADFLVQKTFLSKIL